MQRLEQETIDALVLVEGIAIIHINTKYTTGSFSSKDITKKIEKQTLHVDDTANKSFKYKKQNYELLPTQSYSQNLQLMTISPGTCSCNSTMEFIQLSDRGREV